MSEARMLPIKLETVGILLAYLVPAIGLSHALEDPRYTVWALAVVLLACVWRMRWSGGSLLDLAAALGSGGLTYYMWVETRMPTAALAVSILSLQSYKLLFPRLTQPRKLAPPLSQAMFPGGSEREAAVVEAASLVLLGAASAQSFRPSFAPLFVLGGVSLVVARIGRARARASALLPQSATPRARPSAPRARARMIAYTAAGGTLIGALLLFATPRLGTRYLPRHLQTGERMSGFTDQVGLDDIGRLQQSTAPAFHVEVPAGSIGLGPEAYWRGAALDSYDGARWSHSEAGRLHARLRGRGGGLFEARRLYGRDAPGARRVVLYLEPLGTRMLFTTGAIRSMRFRGLSPDSVWRTELATIYTKQPYSAALCYELEYYPNQVPLFLDNTPLANLSRLRCLQLPADVDRERLRAYARQVLDDAGVPRDAPYADIATAIELHLQTGFEYTLDGARTPGTEPVADFLFNRRSGHCEVFASAMVVLLRCLGIPARVITGYRSRPEAGSATHTVRQSDAHAWVEAKTGRRWQRFEPTPAASWGTANPEVSLRERIELLWFKWIVAYDAREQAGLLASIARWAINAARAVWAVVAQPLSLALLVVAALLLGGAWFARRSLRRARGIAGFVPGAALQPLLRELARRGQVRGAGETLRAFARRADTPERAVSQAVAAYYGARFGPADPAAQRAVEEAVAAALEAVGRTERAG